MLPAIILGMEDKERFMKEALKQAKKGFDKGECPIGCVIVKDGKVLVRSHNLKLTKCNPILHAEVVAIDRHAARSATGVLTTAICTLH